MRVGAPKIALATLAGKYNVKLGALKSRKNREAQVRGPSKKDETRMQPKEVFVK
ncbi:MAG TPA: hypothetical protein K8V56_21345 [Sporosarcina psychrophila]|uniref:Uncharacterized protein n=1 Tax=Sporosarcina psychrophila TaxID=1476 RepID=A0A921KFK7_SPOPS|nr:hypothetical protein [Sporosarcina psychrophila]